MEEVRCSLLYGTASVPYGARGRFLLILCITSLFSNLCNYEHDNCAWQYMEKKRGRHKFYCGIYQQNAHKLAFHESIIKDIMCVVYLKLCLRVCETKGGKIEFLS